MELQDSLQFFQDFFENEQQIARRQKQVNR